MKFEQQTAINTIKIILVAFDVKPLAVLNNKPKMIKGKKKIMNDLIVKLTA
jgi:hypothetical protein